MCYLHEKLLVIHWQNQLFMNKTWYYAMLPGNTNCPVTSHARWCHGGHLSINRFICSTLSIVHRVIFCCMTHKCMVFGIFYNNLSTRQDTKVSKLFRCRPYEYIIFRNRHIQGNKKQLLCTKKIVVGTYFSLLSYCSWRHSQVRLNN